MTATEETTGTRSRAKTMDVYRQWWLHDARWYQGVAKRFGHEVANEINAEAMRYVAEHVGKLVVKRSGRRPAADLAELRERYEACAEAMFPSELRDGGVDIIGEDLLELTMRQNFAVTMVRMAGSLEGYECPCTDIHAGWSAGLGVELTENRATGCLRHGDPACRLLMRVGGCASDPGDPGTKE